MFDNFEDMRREMNRIFKSALSEFAQGAMDIYEEDGKLIIKIDMPGVNKEDIELQLTEDTISVRAERKSESVEEKKNYYKSERSYKSYNFERTLPVEVNPDTAKAKYENGVLTVEAEISEKEKKKSKKVDIQ